MQIIVMTFVNTPPPSAVILYANVCVYCRKREAGGAGPGQHCGERFT